MSPKNHLVPGIAALLAVLLLSAGLRPLPSQAQGRIRIWGDDRNFELGLGRKGTYNEPHRSPGVSGFVAVASGSAFGMALRSDGTVWAWGQNTRGQLGDGTTIDRSEPLPISGLTNVTAIACGYNHALAVRSDGTVFAWGDDSSGALGDGSTTGYRARPNQVAGLDNVVSVAASTGYSIALRSDGTVWTFGTVPRQISGLANVTAISSGQSLFLALSSDGAVWTLNGETPVAVDIDNVTAISAGYTHALAVKRDGTVWAWGGNIAGQLGYNPPNPQSPYSDVPMMVNGLTDVVSVSAGYLHSLALKRDGTLWSWGANASGELGHAGSGPTPQPVNGISDVTVVNASGFVGLFARYFEGVPVPLNGLTTSFALTKGGYLWAWGDTHFGRSGDSVPLYRSTQTQIPGFSGVTNVWSGWGNVVASKNDGSLWYWGSAPTKFPGLSDVVNVFRNLAVKRDGTLWKFDTYQGTATQITALDDVKQVTISYDYSSHYKTVALKRDGTVWSYEDDGTLLQAPNIGHVVAIDYDLALKSDGSVWQDINAASGILPYYISLGGLADIVKIHSRGNVHLALRRDGVVLAWGDNTSGQLGDGTTVSRDTPAPVVGLSDVKDVATSGTHCLAVRSDGTVWAWGSNTVMTYGYPSYATPGGQAGDASGANRLTPAQMPGVTHAVSVAADTGISIALVLDPDTDFDLDGNHDLIWQNTQTGDSVVWYMQGPTFTGSYDYLGQSIPTAWQIVGSADFNNDGHSDLIWQNTQTGDVSYWLMNGTKRLDADLINRITIPLEWKIVGVADMNGDGKPDLIWNDTQTGDVVVWYMDGVQWTGNYDTIAHAIPTQWQVIATADMNGDGKTDLLWRNTQTGDVVVWYMNGPLWSGNYDYIAQGVPLDWKPIGLTDLNGDLMPDLLWQNTTTGDVVIWYLNGPLWSGKYDYVARGVPLDWKLARTH